MNDGAVPRQQMDPAQTSGVAYPGPPPSINPATTISADLKTVILAGLALLAAAGTYYSADSRLSRLSSGADASGTRVTQVEAAVSAIQVRLAVVEVQQAGVASRLDRIEGKLDELLDEQRRGGRKDHR